ncbi:MAG: DUF305 domain-containing protein [Pseudonocardiales bacterium]|nr:MAG: DUF305 domain-containing protein [Pseudonocardiales bacterium]
MRIHKVAGVLAAGTVAGALLAGCGSKPAPVSPPPPRAASSAPASSQPPHNQADVVFLQNMILHQARAISMAQMARNQATSPQVKDLAARIEAEQSPQTQQMSALLTQWGVPAPVTTGGTGAIGGTGNTQMPGTVSGAAFDRMFLQTMTVDHQGAVDMSQTELAQGTNPVTRTLAQQIISTQQAQISEMQALLQVI